MAELDYPKLTRLQKLGVFLIVIGPDAAADVLRQFDDRDIEQICRDIGQVPLVTPLVRAAVLEEFAPVIGNSVGYTLGGLDYARRTLGLARGDHKAGLLLSRVGADAAGSASEIMKEITEMDARQICNLIKDEQPQTIAFLLSYLGSAKAAEIFLLIAPDLRDEVLERLGTIESTPKELVGKIVRNLTRFVAKNHPPDYQSSGGVRAVADLLKIIDKESSKTLLSHLEDRNAALTQAVRRKMYTFDEIRNLPLADLQRVLREADSAHLATAMKSTSEMLREKILSAISKRAAESLREEIAMLGPMRLKDVETAQDAIIQVVRRLEEEGAISLGNDQAAMVA